MLEQAVIFYTHGYLVWSNWLEITQGVWGTAKCWSKISHESAPSISNARSKGRQDQHLLHMDLNATGKCLVEEGQVVEAAGFYSLLQFCEE